MAENSPPVQIPLAGLFGLLGIKTGHNPDVVTGFVQPTVEAAEWWLRATRQRECPPVAGAMVAATQPVLLAAAVPNNEWWYLHSATVFLSTAAGGFAGLQVLDGQGGGGSLLEIGVPALPIPGGNAQAFLTLRDVWLPPGSTILARLGGTIGDQYAIGGVYVSKARV